MINKILTKEEFDAVIIPVFKVKSLSYSYLYEIYELAYEGVEDLLKEQNIQNHFIDSNALINYLLGEFLYSIEELSQDEIMKFMQNEDIKNSISSVVADKYLSLSNFNYKEEAMVNSYLPPVSSINLYINLILNILKIYDHNNPANTLIVDLLTKSLSIARSILNLLCEGYETQAFAIWRTLHECECTLILLDKYGDPVINSYLKHMHFGLAYRSAFVSPEEEAKVMEQVRNEMAEYGLKSKDTKKYIEYGWMNAIEESKTMPNFKLNFRDGLETLAGLHEYSSLYMTSSEILHSTPLLIYSNKKYFYYVTLLNLYESFFRIERLFVSLFFSRVGDEQKKMYLQMRQLYYSQLVNIHQRETKKFEAIQRKKA